MGLRYFSALILLAATASAHEIGTTRVNATFHRDHTFTISVVSARFDRNAAEVRFGDHHLGNALRGTIPSDAKTFSWRYHKAFATYALTTTNEGEAAQTQWVEGDDWSKPVELARTRTTDVMRQYLALGFTHIVPYGLDHILFVLGIFLLSMNVKPVLAQVTAFTVAHSVTLGLTMYGIVSLSPRIVEPMIALSIAYIAIENLTTAQLRPWRVAIVFAFGLLHGMGFAGVLRELGLPRSQFLTALLTFNVGVELGQLSVIATAALLFGWLASRRFVVVASTAIAATGIFWTIERIWS